MFKVTQKLMLENIGRSQMLNLNFVMSMWVWPIKYTWWSKPFSNFFSYKMRLDYHFLWVGVCFKENLKGNKLVLIAFEYASFFKNAV